MKVDSYKCDGCGTEKKGANHWFRAYKLMAGGVVIIPWDGMSPHDDVEDFEAHLCGAACVSKWVSENLL